MCCATWDGRGQKMHSVTVFAAWARQRWLNLHRRHLVGYSTVMAQEADHGDIEAWLTRSPVDWCQIISTRLALRVLPEVLCEDVPDDWFKNFAMSFLRASVTNWI